MTRSCATRGRRAARLFEFLGLEWDERYLAFTSRPRRQDRQCLAGARAALYALLGPRARTMRSSLRELRDYLADLLPLIASRCRAMSQARSPSCRSSPRPLRCCALPEAHELNPIARRSCSARAHAADTRRAGQRIALCYRSRDDLSNGTRRAGAQLCARSCAACWSRWSPPSTTLAPRSWSPSRCRPAAGSRSCSPTAACRRRSYPLTSWCAIYCVEAPAPAADTRRQRRLAPL